MIKQMFLATTNQHECIIASNEEEAKKIEKLFDVLKTHLCLAPYYSDDNTVHFVLGSSRELHLAKILFENLTP